MSEKEKSAALQREILENAGDPVVKREDEEEVQGEEGQKGKKEKKKNRKSLWFR